MSWSGSGHGTTRKLNSFLMSEDRWQRALKEHNGRVKCAKPAVDLKSPWGCSRPYVPLPPADHGGDQKSSARQQRPPSASSARGAAAAAAAGARPQSAQSTGRRPGSAMGQQQQGAAAGAGGARPGSATSRGGASSSGGVGGRGPQSGAQVISQMGLQQQRLCEEMTKMLCGLDKESSKLVLEHLYSAAEEGRLLQSYSGVYPGLLVSNYAATHANGGAAAGDDKAVEAADE